MTRYFFDIQSGRDCFSDEEGLDLPSQRAAEIEAMQTLLGIARDSVLGDRKPDMAVEVRSASEPLFCAALVYRAPGRRQ